jgi:hypothetical protein
MRAGHRDTLVVDPRVSIDVLELMIEDEEARYKLKEDLRVSIV